MALLRRRQDPRRTRPQYTRGPVASSGVYGMNQVRVAVIGAGVAGLTCARVLARADVRSPCSSGRAASADGSARDACGISLSITAHNSSPRAAGRSSSTSEIATRAGVLMPWRPRILEDDRAWDAPIDDWHVGVPGMSAALRPMSRAVELQTGVGVHELLQSQRGWELQTDSGRQNRIFDALAVAIPAPQALSLLGAPRPRVPAPGRRTDGALLDRDDDVRRARRRRRRGAPLDPGPAHLGRVRLEQAAAPGRPAGVGRARVGAVVTRSPRGRRSGGCATAAACVRDGDRRPSSRRHRTCRPTAGGMRSSSSRSACRASSTRRSPPGRAATGASHHESRQPSKAAARWRTRCCRGSGSRRLPRYADTVTAPKAVTRPCRGAAAACGRRRSPAARRRPRGQARSSAESPRR